MERRVLLAIFLAFLVLYVWQALFVKPVPKPGTASTTPAAGASPTAGAPSGATGTTAAGTPPAQPQSGASPAAEAPPTTPAAQTLVGDTNERDVRVETR